MIEDDGFVTTEAAARGASATHPLRVATERGMVVLGPAMNCADGRMVRARCLACGNVVDVFKSAAKRNHSCGCVRHLDQAAKVTTHGMRKSPEYTVWRGMVLR